MIPCQTFQYCFPPQFSVSIFQPGWPFQFGTFPLATLLSFVAWMSIPAPFVQFKITHIFCQKMWDWDGVLKKCDTVCRVWNITVRRSECQYPVLAHDFRRFFELCSWNLETACLFCRLASYILSVIESVVYFLLHINNCVSWLWTSSDMACLVGLKLNWLLYVLRRMFLQETT